MAPDISFGINYSLNEMSPLDPRVLEVIDSLDYVMDEAGFTGWGYGKPIPSTWDNIATWIEQIQLKGKKYHFFLSFFYNYIIILIAFSSSLSVMFFP